MNLSALKKIILFLFVAIYYNTVYAWKDEKETTASPESATEGTAKNHALSIRDKALYLGTYAKQNGYDTTLCFVVNMNPASGDFRFFTFSLRLKKFIDSGLVAHGRCNEAFLKGRKYGNAMGCGCTSLGRYKIGEKYNGKWGASYRLYGLDASNSNAYARNVVLHGHPSIPDKEVVYPLFQSDGCVTVSPGYFSKMSAQIDKCSAPILMEIYDSYELK